VTRYVAHSRRSPVYVANAVHCKIMETSKSLSNERRENRECWGGGQTLYFAGANRKMRNFEGAQGSSY
jgi:hypothetical protein